MLKRANLWEPQRTMPPLRVVTRSPDLALRSYTNNIPTFSHELPPSHANKRIAWSFILHSFAVLLMMGYIYWLPAPKAVESHDRVITPIYLPHMPAPTAVVPKLQAPSPPVLAKVTPPKIQPPPVEKAKVPAAPQPKIETPLETASIPPAVKPLPPKKEIVTNTFASGSSLPATEHKPKREVQTGGFGDPNGVAGASETRRTLTVASVGSFDLPSGAGKGNGSGGTHGTPGTVASAGFGDGVAGPGNGDRPRGTVTAAGFSNMTAASPKARPENKIESTPVEILYKPKPAYTQEARQLRIEGEVLVEVMFSASGEMRVTRVTRGLGHGLDEAALHAAQLIKFRPATRDGHPYDSNGIVHIIFELAE